MSTIVVEGVDASGKSTLLEKARLEIKKRYFVLARHSCRPLSRANVEDFLEFIEGCPRTIDLIVDRHPLISEPIYGPLLRGENLIEGIEDESSAIDRLCLTVDRIIYCRPSDETIVKSLGNNPQLEGIREKIHSLIEAYDLRMSELKQSGIHVIHYSWECYRDPLDALLFGDVPW